MSEYARLQAKVDSPECDLLIELVENAAKMWVSKQTRTRIDAAKIAISLAKFKTDFTNAEIVDRYVKRLESIHKDGGKVKFSSKCTCVNKVIETVYEKVYNEPLIIVKTDGIEQTENQRSIDDLINEVNVKNQCDQERAAMDMGTDGETNSEADDPMDEVPFDDVPHAELVLPIEKFDPWQSDLYMFLTGCCNSFSFEDGVYTLKIGQESLENRFRRRA